MSTVLITGTSAGIGLETAVVLARAGHSVYATMRNLERGAVLRGVVEKEALPISIVKMDVDSDESVDEATSAIRTRAGCIDVLVNNAGVNGPEKNTTEISSWEWDEVLDINLKGSFFCSREAIKKMLSQTKTPYSSNYSIINISSVHQTTPMPLAVPYAASKGGMEMLTKTLALEVADKGIRINAIAPGAIATMMNIDILQDEKKKKEEENKIPMHRIGEPSEIAKVAVFLASADASYITGATFYVDGGLTLVS